MFSYVFIKSLPVSPPLPVRQLLRVLGLGYSEGECTHPLFVRYTLGTYGGSHNVTHPFNTVYLSPNYSQYCLFIPELQWQPRGQMEYLTGRGLLVYARPRWRQALPPSHGLNTKPLLPRREKNTPDHTLGTAPAYPACTWR